MTNIITSEELKAFITKELEDKKAENLLVIDCKNHTDMADYMIFASGRSTKNVSSISDHLSLALKNQLGISNHIEGLGASEWVLIDAGSIIVHVFHPEARERYNLEDFWKR